MVEKEYIEREAAIRVLCDACGNAACPKGLIPRCSYYEKMQSIPAADVRPVVRGKWKPWDLTWGRSYYYCSACEETVDLPTDMGIPLFRYCPNCGADMREEN